MSDLNTDPYHQDISAALKQWDHCRDLVHAATEILDMLKRQATTALRQLDDAHKALHDAIDASQVDS